MKNMSAHDMLTLLGDVNKMGKHEDRLSRLIQSTLRMADEISDEDLEYVAAAYKPEETEGWDPFKDEKRR